MANQLIHLIIVLCLQGNFVSFAESVTSVVVTSEVEFVRMFFAELHMEVLKVEAVLIDSTRRMSLFMVRFVRNVVK